MDPNTVPPTEAPVPQPQPAPVAPAIATPPSQNSYISNPFALFKPSIEVLKLNWKPLLLGAVLPAIVVFAPFALLIGLANTSLALAGAALLIFFGLPVLLIFALVVGPFITAVLLAGAKGEKVSLGDGYRTGFKHCWRFLLTVILTGLAVIGGLVLLIVPGIIFAVWFSLAPYFVVSEGDGAVEAMKKSKALVKGHFWEMIGVLGMSQAFGILVVIPILGQVAVGVLGVLYSAASVVRFAQLKELKSANQPVPSVHWANWVVVAAAVIAIPFRSSLTVKPNNSHDSVPVINNTEIQ